MQKSSRTFDVFLIICFVAGLFLPSLFTRNQEVSTIEKRKLAPLPAMERSWNALLAFPSQFEAFFNDHLGFRDSFVRFNSRLNLLLGVSSDARVLIGKNDWLFYISAKDGNALQDYRKNDPLTHNELWQWRLLLETKYVWLKQQGIRYLFVIAPDKQSIYGEYFPSHFRPVGKQTRLDQLMEFMEGSEVPIIDLRPTLLEAKTMGQLYYKTDTHWTDLGASIAHYKIATKLHEFYPAIQPIDYGRESFTLEPYSGDITQMLNLFDIVRERAPRFSQPFPPCSTHKIEQILNDWPVFYTDCGSSSPKAVIFTDSFFVALQPFISQHLGNTLFIAMWPTYNQFEQFLEGKKPDIVIEERVERSLKVIHALPDSLDESYHANQSVLARLFQKGTEVYKMPVWKPDQLVALNQVEIRPVAEGYQLLALGSDPYIGLPKIEGDKSLHYVIKMELVTQRATNWQIFYGMENMTGYNDEHSLSGPLAAGESTVYFILAGENLADPIRIDPGMAEGQYVLKSVEIRSMKSF